MFVFNEKTGKLLNLDMVSEVLVGREKNKLTIARENGAMGIFADYSTETEAREALWKLMEYEDTELSPEEIERVNKFEDIPHTCDTCRRYGKSDHNCYYCRHKERPDLWESKEDIHE